jgi:hypothetical protein
VGNGDAAVGVAVFDAPIFFLGKGLARIISKLRPEAGSGKKLAVSVVYNIAIESRIPREAEALW